MDVFIIGYIKPDDITAVGHQGSDVAVAEVEDAFNDLLFCLFNGSLFGAFTDDGLDLFFCYLVIFCLEAQQAYNQLWSTWSSSQMKG